MGGAADATRAQAADEPSDHLGPARWSQSRASSTPIRRLGVQWEGSVRDPIRLAALTGTNQVGRPSGLGMEAEARLSPPERRNSQTVAEGRRTAAQAPTSGSLCVERPLSLGL